MLADRLEASGREAPAVSAGVRKARLRVPGKNGMHGGIAANAPGVFRCTVHPPALGGDIAGLAPVGLPLTSSTPRKARSLPHSTTRRVARSASGHRVLVRYVPGRERLPAVGLVRRKGRRQGRGRRWRDAVRPRRSETDSAPSGGLVSPGCRRRRRSAMSRLSVSNRARPLPRPAGKVVGPPLGT